MSERGSGIYRGNGVSRPTRKGKQEGQADTKRPRVVEISATVRGVREVIVVAQRQRSVAARRNRRLLDRRST